MGPLAGHFSDEEQVILLEAARIALADGDIFDDIVEQMDISDDEMVHLREKLQGVMNKESATADEDEDV